MMVVARVQEEELAEPDKALATNTEILKLDENNAQAIAALERLYLRTERYDELLGIYEKKLAPRERQGSAEGDPLQGRVDLRAGDQGQRQGDRRLPGHPQGLRATSCRRYRALDRIYVATQQWKELSPVIQRELKLVPPGDNGAIVELKFRLGQLREQHLGDVKGAIDMYRDILDLEPTHAGARAGARAAARRRGAPADGGGHPRADLRAHRGVGAAHRGARDPAAPREGAVEPRVAAACASASCRRRKIGDGEKAFDAYARASARIRRTRRRAPSSSGWRRSTSRGRSSWRSTSRRSSKLKPRGRRQRRCCASCSSRSPRRTTRSSRSRRRRSSTSAARRASSPTIRTALEALERLYTRNERWPELLEVYRKKVELSPEPAAREQIYFRMAYLWEEMLGNVDEAIATYKEVLAQADSANVKALKALDRLYLGAEAVARAGRQPDAAAPAHRRQGARRSRCWCGWRRCASASSARWRRRSTPIARCSSSIATTTRRCSALERLVHAARSRAAGRHHPRADLQGARRVAEARRRRTRSWCATRWIRRARSSCSIRSAICTRWPSEDARGVPHLRPRAARGAGAQGDADAARAAGAHARSLEGPGQLVRLGRRAGGQGVGRRRAADAAADARRADRGDAARRQRRRGGRLPSRAQGGAAPARRGQRARSDLPPHRRVHQAGRRGAGQGRHGQAPSTRRRSCCFKAAQIYEEVLENADRAIDVYRQVLVARRERSRRRSTRSSGLYIRLERWEPLKDVYSKKAELATQPDEKKQMLFVLGQVYDRELKDLTRAIETYQTILDLDPEDVTAIQALDRLYQQAGRWYDLLQILEREVELSSSTGETVSLKHRIGQLWEKELKDLGRAVEAYRDVLKLDGTHEPTLVALDGLVHGDQEPVLAAQVLEPIFEAGGEWERLIDVLDVMVRHTDDPIRRVELLHRIADYYERRLESPMDAFKAYGAGAQAKTRRTRSRSATSSGSPIRPRRGTSWRALVRGRARQAARSAAAGRHAPARRARLRRGARADRARHRDLPPRRRRRGGEPRRDPRARSALSADRALERARRRPAPRDPARAATTARSSRCSSASASSTSRTCATSTTAIERLSRDPQVRRRPRADAGGARAPLRRGRQADRDRRHPRAALSAWPSSGRSWSRSTRSSSTS